MGHFRQIDMQYISASSLQKIYYLTDEITALL